MLAARKTCDQQLQHLVQEQRAPFQTEQLDRYSTAANPAELQEVKAASDAFADKLVAEMAAEWEEFKKQVEALADDPRLSGGKPKGYPGTHGRWILQPLLRAQKTDEMYYNMLEEAFLKASHRIKPDEDSYKGSLKVACLEKSRELVGDFTEDLKSLAHGSGKPDRLEVRLKAARSDSPVPSDNQPQGPPDLDDLSPEALRKFYEDLYINFGRGQIDAVLQAISERQVRADQTMTGAAWNSEPGAKTRKALEGICLTELDAFNEKLHAVRRSLVAVRDMTPREKEQAEQARDARAQDKLQVITHDWEVLDFKLDRRDKSADQMRDLAEKKAKNQTDVVASICRELIASNIKQSSDMDAHPPLHPIEPAVWVTGVRGLLERAIVAGHEGFKAKMAQVFDRPEGVRPFPDCNGN